MLKRLPNGAWTPPVFLLANSDCWFWRSAVGQIVAGFWMGSRSESMPKLRAGYLSPILSLKESGLKSDLPGLACSLRASL